MQIADFMTWIGMSDKGNIVKLIAGKRVRYAPGNFRYLRQQSRCVMGRAANVIVYGAG
jgi:hypothetical protein